MSVGSDDEPPDDDGLGDDDGPDCYTNYAIVSIETPEGQIAESLTFDVEIVSARPLSEEELNLAALRQTQPWVDTLLSSPGFRARFGNNPTITIVASGVLRTC